jgi:2Fe-2S iron-sulfur cluster binding domain
MNRERQYRESSKLRSKSWSETASTPLAAEAVTFSMRSQLLRAASRARRPASINATRSFSSTVQRSAEVELTVDGKKVSIEAGSALIQACEKAGVTIPRYCYHE